MGNVQLEIFFYVNDLVRFEYFPTETIIRTRLGQSFASFGFYDVLFDIN